MRAEGRERKKGQAQKEDVRHEGVNRALGHGRVLLVRVAGEGALRSVNVRMLKSDRGRPVSEWRHVWTIEAGAAGGHPVLLIHAGRALWWYGQARKVTYILIDDHDDRSKRSEHDGTARPPSTDVPYP